MSALIHAVNLYRLLEDVGVDESGVVVKKNFSLTADMRREIISLWRSPDCSSYSLEVTSGISSLEDESRSDELNSLVSENIDSIRLGFLRSSCYRNVDDFIQRCNTLNHGVIPDQLFIASLNYRRGESDHLPEDIRKIEHYCELIELLKGTCHFVDRRPDSASSKAVFVISNEDSKSMEPVYVDLCFTSGLLERGLIDLSPLKEIVGLKDGSAHKEEKLSTFRVAVWEILTFKREVSSDLYSLVEHWDDLIDKYFATYELYIRGFSFTKFQNEVHEFLVDSANKANDLVGTIANKVAIVPSLFGVWLLAIKQEKPDFVLNIGLVAIATFALAIVVMVLDNQHFMIAKLREVANERFDLFKKKAHENPDLIKRRDEVVDSFIDKNDRELSSRLRKINTRLIIIRISAWAFLLVMFYGAVKTFWQYQTPFESVLVLIVLSLICLASIISILKS